MRIKKIINIDANTVVANVHKRLKSDIHNLLTAIVPRHPHRKSQILQELSPLTCVVRSQQGQVNSNTDIYLGDTIGKINRVSALLKNKVNWGFFIV